MVRRLMGMVWELSGTQGDGNGMGTEWYAG